MKVGSASHIGKVRATNQDNYFICTKRVEPFYCIVADGMGGHSGGEVASRMATQQLEQYIEDHLLDCKTPADYSKMLVDAFDAANKAIFTASRSMEGCVGMGTTATAALVADGVLIVAHAGDSRAYLLDETLRQLTFDHTVVADLLMRGEITQEQARTDSRRHMITRALGSEHLIQVDTYTFDYAGQRVFLCSDGLYNEVSQEQIIQVLSETQDLQEAADLLVELANKAGGNDNITVVVFGKE